MNIEAGELPGGLPYLVTGSGRPLVISPGLGPSNANPTGWQRTIEVKATLAPFADRFRVWRINRPVGIRPGITAAELAAAYARAVEALLDRSGRSGEPVDLIGMSSGGVTALQLAADHPHLVRRLVLAGTGARLGPFGRSISARAMKLAQQGERRRVFAAVGPAAATGPVTRVLFAALGWLAAPEKGWDPSEFVATLQIDLDADLTDRLADITAPTLVIAGSKDPTYPIDDIRAMTAAIPDARMLISPTGHAGALSGRRFVEAARDFLGQGTACGS